LRLLSFDYLIAFLCYWIAFDKIFVATLVRVVKELYTKKKAQTTKQISLKSCTMIFLNWAFCKVQQVSSKPEHCFVSFTRIRFLQSYEVESKLAKSLSKV